MQPALTISFIVHDDFSHIEAALRSLQQNTRSLYIAYVTINTGFVPMVDQLRPAFPEVRFVVNDQPRGFAANHNAIMLIADTPYVALLNDDVTFTPGALDTLLAYLDAHDDVGLVGPLVQNPDGTPQLSAFSDPSLFRMLYKISGLGSLTRHGGLVRRMLQRFGLARRLGVESLNTELITHFVPVIVGVSMVVRRQAYLDAGLIDEGTLMYGEEVGWHWRLRQHGWKLALVTEAQITHYNPQSELTGWKLAEHRKSILQYFLNYRSRTQTLIIRCAIIGVHTIGTLVYLPLNRAKSRAHWQAVKVGLYWKSTVSVT
jgi:hypothetical protein